MKKKKKVRLWMLIMTVLVTATLSGCSTDSELPAEGTEGNAQTEGEESKAQYPYDYTDPSIFEVEDFWNYIPMAQLSGVKSDGSFFELPGVGDHVIMQAGCTDGTYAYMMLNAQDVIVDDEEVELSILFKVNMSTWEVVGQSEVLWLEHANGMTYNRNLNKLVVAHAASPVLSFVDVDTLTFDPNEDVTLDQAFYDIEYNAERDQYVLATRGREKTNCDIAIYSSDFTEIAYFEGVESGIGNQCLYADNDHIYLGRTGALNGIAPGVEIFLIYNWDGEFLGVYRLNSASEHEALFTYNDELYVTFNLGNGGRVYRINFDFEMLDYKGQQEK